MKQKRIRFFSLQDNREDSAPKPTQKESLTGYVSATGKLVFPLKTAESLGFLATVKHFQVGVAAGKKKATSIYLIPADASLPDTFTVQKIGSRYGMELGGILSKSGIDYTKAKHRFTIKSFDYEQEGITGLELRLSQQVADKETVGKPRGRKPKVAAVE